jgi:hypothetical protein
MSKVVKWLVTSNLSLENCAVNFTKAVGTPLSIILHTIFFVGIFALKFFKVSYENIMLILTTIVSLEAIYLSIFIQMTVIRSEKKIETVTENLEEVTENLEDMQENIEDLVIDDIERNN